ncbi:SrtB family sortase [Romboutsia weinsteinii]|uniref:SrtB family sortase n=1 Tax=Romboutsia weinsteinii TaxID=2020949 RepID=A0A371J3U6_9FIRM|nr:class B sortase [Romboutsia weinsteinii]RDY27460.1 SrtB family sortase [Romboutsia weinsteinii]
MKSVIRWIVNIVLIAIIIYCGYNIYLKLTDYKEADKTYTKIQEIKNTGKEDLSTLNPDFRAWIKVDNTNIDYPVVQGKDNNYYLNKDFYSNKLGSGSIFMDYRNDYKNDRNLIIYGHNMKNKTMFAQLEKFKDENFWKENNKIRLVENDKEYIYEVFSAYFVNPDFDYLRNEFNSDEEYKNYLQAIKSKSLFSSDLPVSTDDKIITLSTCSYEFNDARTVIHGKLISE